MRKNKSKMRKIIMQERKEENGQETKVERGKKSRKGEKEKKMKEKQK